MARYTRDICPCIADDEPADEPVASWREIWVNTLLTGVANFLGYLPVVVNAASCGHGHHLDRTEQTALLAGYGLAMAIQNSVHIGPAVGITSVFDTLVSQAHGAKDYQQCVRVLGQGRAVLTVHWLCIVPVAWFSESILVWLGIDAAAAAHAGTFNRINLLSWLPRSQMYASRRFLANMNRPGPNTRITTLALAQHVLVLLGLGFNVPLQTLAWVSVSSTWTHTLLLAGYLFYAAHALSLRRRLLLREAFTFRGSGPLLRMSLPCVVQSCSEFWAVEVFTLMSGYLDTASVAACTVAYNITTLCYLMGVGASGAASGFIGKAIGEGHLVTARRTILRFSSAVVLLWFPCGGVLLFGAWHLAALFSPQLSVQERLAPVLQIYALTLLVDNVNLVLSAALRALGRPRAVSCIYLACFYPVMLPLAYLLALPFNFGLLGMYGAYLLTVIFICVAMAATLYRTSFETAAAECRERLVSASEVCADAGTEALELS